MYHATIYITVHNSILFFFFSSRRRHTRLQGDWSSDVCSSDLHFLIGTRTAVEQAARRLGFEFWKYDEHVMHDTRILYFDERGTLVETREAAGYETTLR